MPSFIRGLFVLMLALSAGCASLIDGPDRPLTASELVGVYDYGHAGFAETLELSADRSYSRTLHGHLGQESASFTGTWKVEGTAIVFTPADGQPADSAPKPAEAFFHRHQPAFAPQHLVASGKVSDWFVYRPRASK